MSYKGRDRNQKPKGLAGHAEEFAKLAERKRIQQAREEDRKLDEAPTESEAERLGLRAKAKRALVGGIVRLEEGSAKYNEARRIWMEDQAPQVYKDAVKLRQALQDTLREEKEKYTIQPEAEQAAKNIIASLNVAIVKWEQEFPKHIKMYFEKTDVLSDSDSYKFRWDERRINALTADLKSASSSAIRENKAGLMKDPGFWEQIKEKINNFLEEHGFDKFFEVKQTLFAHKTNVTEPLEGLEDEGPKLS
ncbi:hypothetical protein [Legionella bozemanae]|uniref:hypothetical protein n=1 Tax=Legionella bozemanae TaxID=447 RepID=UPI00399C93BF